MRAMRAGYCRHVPEGKGEHVYIGIGTIILIIILVILLT
jgi:hypothetical protein